MNIEVLKQMEREYKIRFYIGLAAAIILIAICIYAYSTNSELNIIIFLPLIYTVISTVFIYKDLKETSDILDRVGRETKNN